MLGLWIKRQVFKHYPLTLPRVSFTTRANPGIMVKTTAVSVSSHSKTPAVTNPSKALAPVKNTVSPYTVVKPAEQDVLMTVYNSVCPPGFPKKLFKELCFIATINDCRKMNMPAEHWIPLTQYSFNSFGEGIEFTQRLVASTRLLEKVIPKLFKDKLEKDGIMVDFTKILPTDLLVLSPKFFVNTLSKVSMKTQVTLPYEIWAQFEVNRQLIHTRLGFTFDNGLPQGQYLCFGPKDPFTYEKYMTPWLNYYNQTPNKHPDFVLVLDKPVVINDNPKTLIGFDLKLGQVTPEKNIVKACVNDTELTTTLLDIHGALLSYLSKVIPTYTSYDQYLATSLTKALDANIKKFLITEDLFYFQNTYNRLYENYSSLFLRNKIGFNFIVNLPLTNLRIPQENSSQFSAQFRNYFSTRGTVVSHFAEKIAEQNPKGINPNSTMQQFVLDLLKKNKSL